MTSCCLHLWKPNLIQPTFVLDYPEEMSPPAKAKPDTPGYVERFEAFAFGMEIANSYSELNDPAVQRARFEDQARDTATIMKTKTSTDKTMTSSQPWNTACLPPAVWASVLTGW